MKPFWSDPDTYFSIAALILLLAAGVGLMGICGMTSGQAIWVGVGLVLAAVSCLGSGTNFRGKNPR